MSEKYLQKVIKKRVMKSGNPEMGALISASAVFLTKTSTPLKWRMLNLLSTWLRSMAGSNN